MSEICLLSEIETHRWRFNSGQRPAPCEKGKHRHVSTLEARKPLGGGLVEVVLIDGRECLLPLNIKTRVGPRRSAGYVVVQALDD